MRTTTTLLSALLIATLASDAVACGDALYRVGTGIAYREYTAPLPGNVLIYGATVNATDLAAALTRSGHNVSVVANALALDIEMQKGGYDVIIAPYRDHQTINAASRSSGIPYLPVAQNKEEEAAAEETYDYVLVADRDELKHYLKAIHKTLRNKTVRG